MALALFLLFETVHDRDVGADAFVGHYVLEEPFLAFKIQTDFLVCCSSGVGLQHLVEEGDDDLHSLFHRGRVGCKPIFFEYTL